VVNREADVAVEGAGIDAVLPVERGVDDEVLEKPMECVERLLIIGW
jgi:hypothetical protein